MPGQYALAADCITPSHGTHVTINGIVSENASLTSPLIIGGTVSLASFVGGTINSADLFYIPTECAVGGFSVPGTVTSYVRSYVLGNLVFISGTGVIGTGIDELLSSTTALPYPPAAPSSIPVRTRSDATWTWGTMNIATDGTFTFAKGPAGTEIFATGNDAEVAQFNGFYNRSLVLN